MKVAVFDTYVKKKQGGIMHFDVIVPEGTEAEEVYRFGREYLRQKDQEGQELASRECKFCHIEQVQDHMARDISAKGYYILEMQGC